MRCQVTDVEKDVLSVGASMQTGFSFLFSPLGSYMFAGALAPPTIELPKERLLHEDNLFYLEVEEIGDQSSNLNAPVVVTADGTHLC